MKKINGIELNYNESQKKIYFILERHRNRYLIIYGWQQIENIQENLLTLYGTSKEFVFLFKVMMVFVQYGISK